MQLLTGKGIFGQVEELTGLPTPVVATFFVGIAVNHLLAGTSPSSPTWSPENRADAQKRGDYNVRENPLKCAF